MDVKNAAERGFCENFEITQDFLHNIEQYIIKCINERKNEICACKKPVKKKMTLSEAGRLGGFKRAENIKKRKEEQKLNDQIFLDKICSLFFQD